MPLGPGPGLGPWSWYCHALCICVTAWTNKEPKQIGEPDAGTIFVITNKMLVSTIDEEDGYIIVNNTVNDLVSGVITDQTGVML